MHAESSRAGAPVRYNDWFESVVVSTARGRPEMRFRCLLTFVMFGMSGALFAQDLPISDPAAQESSASAGAPLPELQTFPVAAAMDVLEPRVARDSKNAALKALQDSADQGNPISQYVMGSLYRLGKDHPAHVVDKDLDKAEVYLSNAAIQGQLGAMAGMALIKLERDRPDDALVWSWAYAQFTASDSEHYGGNKRVGQYALKLFLKCRERVGKARADSAEMQTYKKAFIDQYGPRISPTLGRAAQMYWGGPLKLLSSELRPPSGISTRFPALAVFMLEVRPDGSVARAVAIDSLSNERIASLWLSQVRDSLTFNSLTEAAPQRLRIGFIPFELEWGE